MKRLLLTALALAALAAWASPADAGEGTITKVRGRTLTIDKGADDGLEVGLEVMIMRPPGEAIIHPLTGENLGAPEIEIAGGRINKVSARAASIQLDGNPIISVRSGDMARFLTLEEKMVQDQEVATETAEQAARERGSIRSESSRLARNISSIQGSIRGLEKAIRDLRRFDDDVVKPQFNAINRQINEMRGELNQLRETVSLLNAVPVQEIGEGGDGEMSSEDVERLRLLIQEEIDNLQGQLAVVQPLPGASPTAPDLVVDDEGMEGLEEETSIFQNLLFWLGLGAVGLLGVAFWLYTRMGVGGDEDDEEDDEDDELMDDEDDDDDDLDIEVEEEDDIVVEETS